MRLTLPLLLLALLTACGQAGPLVRPADIAPKPSVVPVTPAPAAETPAPAAEPEPEKTPEATAPAN